MGLLTLFGYNTERLFDLTNNLNTGRHTYVYTYRYPITILIVIGSIVLMGSSLIHRGWWIIGLYGCYIISQQLNKKSIGMIKEISIASIYTLTLVWLPFTTINSHLSGLFYCVALINLLVQSINDYSIDNQKTYNIIQRIGIKAGYGLILILFLIFMLIMNNNQYDKLLLLTALFNTSILFLHNYKPNTDRAHHLGELVFGCHGMVLFVSELIR